MSRDINIRPSYDPYNFPYTSNTNISDIFNQSSRQQDFKVVPTQYVNQNTAKNYSFDFGLQQDPKYLQRPVPQSTATQSQLSQQPKPVYTEIIHEEQQVRVVTKNDIEEPWRVKCAILEKQIHELQQENNKYRGMSQQLTEKVTYYEDTGRVNMLSQECDRLKQVIIDLNQELESWRQRYLSLEMQLKTRANVEQEIERMRRAVQDNENVMQMEMNRLREQLDEWQRRYQLLESNQQDALQNVQKSRGNEQLILSLQSELKKQEMTIRAKNDDYDTLLQKFNRLERIMRDSEYQNAETTNLRKIIDERNREIEQLRKQSIYGQSKDLENKIQLYKSEIDRLAQIIVQKDTELNAYKEQVKRPNIRQN